MKLESNNKNTPCGQKFRHWLAVFAISVFIALITITTNGQAKRRTATSTKQTEAAKTETSPAKPITQGSAQAPKKNERPASAQNTASGAPAKSEQDLDLFSYEFTQPDFVMSRILITHNAAGDGELAFKKSGLDEMLSEPIKLTPAVLERIEKAYLALNFLDSEENYQFEKDYSHLGVVKITMKRGGRTRTAEFNWTENPYAKILKDEYRKISNQFLWMFEIGVARQNQPLDSPRLMTSLDSLLRRNELADSAQMLPFLNGLSDDERLPLIARNHAARIAKQIEKSKK